MDAQLKLATIKFFFVVKDRSLVAVLTKLYISFLFFFEWSYALLDVDFAMPTHSRSLAKKPHVFYYGVAELSKLV